MYIRPELESRRFPSHIRQFISITGWQSWKRRLDWLRRQVRYNAAIAHYLIDRFELELAFSDIYKRRKLTGKYAVKEEVAAEYRFLSFSCMLPLVYGRLNPVGQNRSCLSMKVRSPMPCSCSCLSPTRSQRRRRELHGADSDMAQRLETAMAHTLRLGSLAELHG